MKQIKCRPGNKLCGERCIKKEWECHDGEVVQPKSKGIGIGKIAIGLGIATGLAAAAYTAYKLKGGFRSNSKSNTTTNEKFDPDKILNQDTQDRLEQLGFDKSNLPKIGNTLKKEESVVTKAVEAIPEHKGFYQTLLRDAKQLSITDFENSVGIEIQPEIKSKFGNEPAILLVDKNSEAGRELYKAYKRGEDSDPMYDIYLKKVVILHSPEDKIYPSNVSRELLQAYRYKTGQWLYSDKELSQKLKNLPQDNLEHLATANWTSEFAWKEAVDAYKKSGIEIDLDFFKRAKVEEYLALIN